MDKAIQDTLIKTLEHLHTYYNIYVYIHIHAYIDRYTYTCMHTYSLAKFQYMNMDETIQDTLKILERLEPTAPIQQMLSSTSAKRDPHPRKKMHIHVIIALYKENVAWIRGFCGEPIFWKEDVQVDWFFYVKYPGRDLADVRREAHAAWNQSAGCRVRDAHVHVSRLVNTGRESHTHAVHMFSHSTEYGDVNVFLQGHCQTGEC
jgi:hypothetical protein